MSSTLLMQRSKQTHNMKITDLHLQVGNFFTTFAY